MLRKEKPNILITNASEVVTCASRGFLPLFREDFGELVIYKNGAVAVGGGKILAVGDTKILEKQFGGAGEAIDACGKTVLPGFVDCHTHLVFAGSRCEEYEEKINGLNYIEIAQKGFSAGILYTAEMTKKAPKSELIKKGLKDLDTMMRHGTTTVEIKSGYGLDTETELKILEAIEALAIHPMTVIPTFLAHAFPADCDKSDKTQRSAYVAGLKNILVAAKERKLAEYCDVFCDPLAFTIDESEDILRMAQRLGFKLKMHAEQTAYLGGADLAAELQAVSADHLDFISQEGIKKMVGAGVIAVLLPTVTFHLMEMIPNPKRKWRAAKPSLPLVTEKIIRSGLPVALATDYNPGSSPCLSMQMAMQCAARMYRMSPAQIIRAATINAARAIGREKEIGSLERGKKADIIICDCPSHKILIDNFGVNLVETVIKDGMVIK